MDYKHNQIIAENDSKRSKFIYHFLRTKKNNFSNEEIIIPKTIIQYWHNSDELPDDVLECIQSWKTLKDKDFGFKLFDDNLAKEFIKNNLDEVHLQSYLKCHHPAMRCDYFRLCYLYIFGGFYIDCDELYSGGVIDFLYMNNNIKIQPLCYNLNKAQMVEINTFLNRPYKNYNIYYINNNPIISPPKHELIFIALERATKRLICEDDIFDIQSTTGPGNLSASLIYYLLKNNNDIEIIEDWGIISHAPWPLSYRNDDRNWRLYNANNKKWFD
jgi:mannosyltransferase OCH1-like enzyme